MSAGRSKIQQPALRFHFHEGAEQAPPPSRKSKFDCNRSQKSNYFCGLCALGEGLQENPQDASVLYLKSQEVETQKSICLKITTIFPHGDTKPKDEITVSSQRSPGSEAQTDRQTRVCH